MAKERSYVWPVISAVIAVVILFLSLPMGARSWAPGFLRSADFHLGLDLAGGTQLDFRISEEEINAQIARLKQQIIDREAGGAGSEELNELRIQLQSVEGQKENLIEAIRLVLERRINALGVSEATITPSYVGDEKHLLVECPGVIDVQQCIATVGKTIQLEFKEQVTEATDDFRADVEQKVADAQARMRNSGATLQTLGQDLTDISVSYQDTQTIFRDQTPQGLESIWDKTPESGVMRLAATVQVQTQDENGQAVPKDIPGIFLIEVLQPKFSTGRTVNVASEAFTILAGSEEGLSASTVTDTPLNQNVPSEVAAALRSLTPGQMRVVPMQDGSARVVFMRKHTPGDTRMRASHIVVAYKGAAEAAATVTRTKEEALARAQEAKSKVDAGGNFADLARQYSDGPSASQGGSLGEITRETMAAAPTFVQAAFALAQNGVSAVTETPFGYHIIRADSAPALSPDIVSYEELIVSGEDAENRANTLLANLQAGKVEAMQEAIAVRSLFFSLEPTGWKDTLLDGKHFRSATVTLDPTTNIPVVQILFDQEGATLFQELTKNNIGKQLAIFVGGQLVSAPTVQQEISGGSAVITGSGNFEEATRLAQDLNTGAIPAPIFLAGQHTVEATLGAAALQTSMKASLIGLIILMVMMLLIYRLLGLVANIALVIYAFIFIAILKLPLLFFTHQYIVLTLAGLAGIILSIGMAVDANVLIYERIKEELKKGKMLKTAIETGYARAWPSIRDGNVSTFITSIILFTVGTSIVRGFAVTLSMGVLVSMFTAIVVSRWILRKLIANPSIAANAGLFMSSGGRKEYDQNNG